MKYVALLFAVLVMVAIADAEGEAEDLRPEYCKGVINDPNSCIGRKCNKDNTQEYKEACGLSLCGEGETLQKIEQDLSKPYPQCCPRLICE